MSETKDICLDCATCGTTPRRFRPSPEAGDTWRCSECGEPYGGPEPRGDGGKPGTVAK